MRILVAMLMVSALWLYPPMIEAQTPGSARPEQAQIITKDNLKLVQQRLQAEGVYAGPLDGELSAQTEEALRQYQQKQKLPVSGAPDAATLKELQVNIPASKEGSGN
jgi:peptidoglycan hydrolase-like protein with peptidoglycan-binding domain